MTRYFAGIDGGQSGTVAIVADDRGGLLGRGVAGPADEVGESPASTRLRDALAGALRRAVSAAGLRDDARFEVVVAGISGYDGSARGAAPEFNAERELVLHDAPIAHAGALGGDTGVVAIAGTGSVVYAQGDRKDSLTLGGWGYLFGDEGSAFWIAREALAQLMRAEDERDDRLTAERGSALEFFERPSLRSIQQGYALHEISRDRIAAFAPAVLATPSFAAIAERGAVRLIDLVGVAMRASGTSDVAFTGGLCAVAPYRERLRSTLREKQPDARLHDARYEPAAGALLLAYRQAGLPVRELRNAS